MKQFDLISFLFGIILTYGIGLMPALVFRFVVFRRAISKLGALLICFIWFLIWSILIFSLKSASGEEPRLSGGSFIMIFVSYYILSKGYIQKTKRTTKNSQLVIHCPQCGRSLKGATEEIIGHTGVCTKCKAEFTIEQKGEKSKD